MANAIASGQKGRLSLKMLTDSPSLTLEFYWCSPQWMLPEETCVYFLEHLANLRTSYPHAEAVDGATHPETAGAGALEGAPGPRRRAVH